MYLSSLIVPRGTIVLPAASTIGSYAAVGYAAPGNCMGWTPFGSVSGANRIGPNGYQLDIMVQFAGSGGPVHIALQGSAAHGYVDWFDYTGNGLDSDNFLYTADSGFIRVGAAQRPYWSWSTGEDLTAGASAALVVSPAFF